MPPKPKAKRKPPQQPRVDGRQTPGRTPLDQMRLGSISRWKLEQLMKKWGLDKTNSTRVAIDRAFAAEFPGVEPPVF